MVTVVVPWRGGCPHRERAWERVRTLYAITHPDWRVVEAAAPDGEWCKATAVMPAVADADDGIIVVADADVWCEGTQGAVQNVETGVVKWAVPHTIVRRLGPDGEPCERPYRGVIGGGIVAAHRDTLLDCPLDPRFVGWGQEDQSWAVALATLHGPPWRGNTDLIHYYHPPQPRLNRKTGSDAGQRLHRRYLKARNDPAAMRALIEEHR